MIIFVIPSSLLCFLWSAVIFFYQLIFVSVCVRDRERQDRVGEILYPLFGNIEKEIYTIKGYVKIMGQPGVTGHLIHLL